MDSSSFAPVPLLYRSCPTNCAASQCRCEAMQLCPLSGLWLSFTLQSEVRGAQRSTWVFKVPPALMNFYSKRFLDHSCLSKSQSCFSLLEQICWIFYIPPPLCDRRKIFLPHSPAFICLVCGSGRYLLLCVRNGWDLISVKALVTANQLKNREEKCESLHSRLSSCQKLLLLWRI